MKRSAAVVTIGVIAATTLCAVALGDSERPKVAALHAQVITPASDALFQAESKPPGTPDAWKEIAARAADLARAAKGLESLESTGEQKEWLQFARALGAAARQAVRAAQAENPDALVSANGEIVSVCEDCHTQYRDAGRSMKE